MPKPPLARGRMDCKSQETFAVTAKAGSRQVPFNKIIVVNPPNPPGYVANRDSMGGYGQLYPIGAPVMPPLDIPYLIAYLAEKGVALEAIDSQGLDLTVEQLANRVARVADENAPGQTLAVVR